MFWTSKKKKAQKAKIFWIAMANMFISEHDRTYDGTLKGEGKSLKGKSYHQGKYLYRMIATNLAIATAGLSGDILGDEQEFEEFQQVVKMLAVEGTEVLENKYTRAFDYSEMDQIHPIELDLLKGVDGQEMGQSLMNYLPVFLSGNDDALPSLVELYLKCFKPVLGEDLPEIMQVRAAGIFRSARQSMSQHF